ncbi:unnamed protein product [Diamesa tonsa]
MCNININIQSKPIVVLLMDKPEFLGGIEGGWYIEYSFDGSTRLMEEEDSACPALLEQDFNRYQRSVPGLRRSGVDANAIRQHFYPDGDWGWIVCSVAFLAHILTTGFQLSYGFLLLYAIKHLGQESAMEAGKWIISTLIYFIFLTKSHNL